MGLVLYRLLSGRLPEWPFKWPMVGNDRLLARVSPEFADLLKKAIQLDPADRYRSGVEMYNAFRKLHRKAKRKITGNRPKKNGASWRKIQWREFQKTYRQDLQTKCQCRHCEGPVAESMVFCPWCGNDHPSQPSETDMPAVCPRCERGVKSDWVYCPWCYGAGFELETSRHYPDKRYAGKCEKRSCGEPLMPFMRYCPWCRSKVKKPWKIATGKERCGSCDWGVAKEFWDYCAWCGTPVDR
jgi:hypothetical protein